MYCICNQLLKFMYIIYYINGKFSIDDSIKQNLNNNQQGFFIKAYLFKVYSQSFETFVFCNVLNV